MPEHDRQLLERYARTGAEDAFRQLVERHIHLVWAAARRINRCEEGVRDIAQEVFTRLARKAASLPADTVLAGWLHRTACHVALQTTRNEARRTRRERDAMQQHALTTDDAARQQATEALLPVLDVALDELPDTDREALLLRYLAVKPLAEVGAAFHISEDAAQKRVVRATERLREILQRRGVTVTGGLVAAALSTAAAELAPAGLATAVSTGALSAAAPLTLFALMKSKLLIASLTAAVVGVPLVLELRQNRALQAELTALQAQAVLANPPVAAAPAADAAELARLREEHGELLRLRGEVTRLRRQLADGEKAAAKQASPVAERAPVLSQAEMEAEGKRDKARNIAMFAGVRARIHALSSAGVLPTTFDYLESEGVRNMTVQDFEFFPHERTIREADHEMILFREREPRQLPDGTWQRAYCFADGSVQLRDSPTTDFSDYEREHTATAANTPKAQDPAPRP